MRSLVVAVALLTSLSAGLAVAQEASKGSWRCANDKASEIPQTQPPSPVTTGSKTFATGNVVASLAKGGPDGVFLFAHLHGKHPGRSSETNFRVGVMVRDEGGYYYMATPALSTDVKGVADKPTRHRHCSGQFRPANKEAADELLSALANGVTLTVEVIGSRKRQNDLENAVQGLRGVAEQLAIQYLTGGSSSGQMLSQANAGKSPMKPPAPSR
jgi:hypothetical protein